MSCDGVPASGAGRTDVAEVRARPCPVEGGGIERLGLVGGVEAHAHSLAGCLSWSACHTSPRSRRVTSRRTRPAGRPAGARAVGHRRTRPAVARPGTQRAGRRQRGGRGVTVRRPGQRVPRHQEGRSRTVVGARAGRSARATAGRRRGFRAQVAGPRPSSNARRGSPGARPTGSVAARSSRRSLTPTCPSATGARTSPRRSGTTRSSSSRGRPARGRRPRSRRSAWSWAAASPA